MSTTYRSRRSRRLDHWDYRSSGAYFVTICTFERQCSFEDPRIATILRTTWNRTARRGGTAPPHEFVVMPNHVHGVLWLPGRRNDRAQAPAGRTRHGIARVPFDIETLERERTMQDSGGASSLRPRGAVPGSVGAVLASFEATSARRINLLRGAPGAPVWQGGYYDRVVRDDEELDAVRQYISDNPAKWDLDHHNPSNWL